MKRYFAYIRVSTPKQGKGVSLEEQHAAIKGHAARHGFEVVEWFEEKETAAKIGRAVFSKMLLRLENDEAEGVIIHKIDRSARNLTDWASLSKLFDRGIDVQFAHDGVDLASRGGRLSADIMAIVAADYIRNLREEVRKGFYGRLKQGLYPLPAPIGYLDQGKGMPKTIDPERAPLIQHAFERYATGAVGLKDLRKELRDIGLRTQKGKPLSLGSLSQVLNNPFYIGLIRIRRTNETYPGIHPPIVRKATFERAQGILRGKTFARVFKHDYLFRRTVVCEQCDLHLIGESQKGHIYYRCHSATCKGTTVREEILDDIVQKHLKLLVGDHRETRELRDMVQAERSKADEGVADIRASLQMRIGNCDERLSRLTDALIDQLVDKETYEARKRALLLERQGLKDQLETVSEADLPRHRALAKLEPASAAYLGYKSANTLERRRILGQFTSNLTARGKNPAIRLQSPYQEIVQWRKSQNGAPRRCRPRARAKQLLDIIMAADSVSQNNSASSNIAKLAGLNSEHRPPSV